MTAAMASHGFVLYHHHRHLRGLSCPPSLCLSSWIWSLEVPWSYVHNFVACAESNVARLLGCDRQAMLLTMYTSRVTGKTFGYGDLIGLFSSLHVSLRNHSQTSPWRLEGRGERMQSCRPPGAVT